MCKLSGSHKSIHVLNEARDRICITGLGNVKSIGGVLDCFAAKGLLILMTSSVVAIGLESSNLLLLVTALTLDGMSRQHHWK